MDKTVDLGKRAEAYVYFAIWCRDHKISPWTAAECIELCNQLQRCKWHQRPYLIEQVTERLKKEGATDIDFRYYDWPKFTSPIGERTQLPTQKFI